MKYPARLLASLATILATNVAISSTISLTAKPAHGLSLKGISFPFPFQTHESPQDHEFESCVETLTELEVDLATTVDACGSALEPKLLSKCVERISVNTALSSGDALSGCVRVRRPIDLSHCVVELDDEFNAMSSETRSSQVMPSQIMGYCGRSLLPTVFKNCVDGIVDATDAEPMLIMDACVEPDYDAPQIFLPTFERTSPQS